MHECNAMQILKTKGNQNSKRGMWKDVFCITYLEFIVKVDHIIFT